MRRATGAGEGAGHGADISIHALREESDAIPVVNGTAVRISIHALREESDAATGTLDVQPGHFNPRSP